MPAAVLLLTIFISAGCQNARRAAQLPAADGENGWFAGHEGDAAALAGIYPLTEENPFIIASYEELIGHLKHGAGVVAFGFDECPRCKNAFPVLEKAFYEMGMDRHAGFRGRIVYYNIFGDREEDNERYRAIVDILKDSLGSDENGDPRIYVPDVFFISSGKVVGNHLDTVPSLEDPWESLSGEQAAELMGIYMDLMEKLDDCDC